MTDFYNELTNERPEFKSIDADDELIVSLQELFQSGQYDKDEFFSLLKEFFKKLKKK